jgi:predicted ATPase
MSDLHLDSLEIKNFRCFEHLTIEKLGRVNLIVGKNGVGKTALLEGLWLMACDGAWPVIHKILYDRNELVRYGALEAVGLDQANSVEKHEQLEAIKSFFFGRPPHSKIIRVNSNQGFKMEGLVLSVGNAKRDFSIGLLSESSLYFGNGIDWDNPNNVSRCGKDFPPLPPRDLLDYQVIEQSKEQKTVFIPLKGLIWQALCTYWDDIALTDKEEQIIDCLRLIDPSITRFTFKGENMKDRVRYPAVKTGRFEQPVPLAHIGEGIQRIFALALAMSTASGGFLLVDEIETGLHYQVQTDMWRAVFKLAKEWDIQVFATTHSWNCIEAFQEATAENDGEEAMLIRLQKRKSGDGIISVLYDKKSLTIATEDNIEVR